MNDILMSRERDESMARESDRWAAHGPYQFGIWLRGARVLYVIGTRCDVTSSGALVLYTKYKDSQEQMAGSFAPGEWRRFWIISALDGYPSHIVDDSAWWTTGQKNKADREKERCKMTPKLRFAVLARDDHTCRTCGKTAADGAKLHVDHIVAISNGGKTEIANLQTLCADCNHGKGVE